MILFNIKLTNAFKRIKNKKLDIDNIYNCGLKIFSVYYNLEHTYTSVATLFTILVVFSYLGILKEKKGLNEKKTFKKVKIIEKKKVLI